MTRKVPIPSRTAPTREQDRGDKSAFAEMFRRLMSLAAEIFPGRSTRLALETQLGLSGSRISKDVRSLEDLGISVSRAGHRYVVADNEFPVMVSSDEAEALLLAHQVLLKSGLPEEQQLLSVIHRIPEAIRAAVGASEAGVGEIDFPPASVDTHPFVEQMAGLRKAIRSGRMFRITYESQRARRGREGSRVRRIDRAELIFVGTVYLNAWEVLPDGSYQPRVFRLDRIMTVEPLATPVSKVYPPMFEYVYRLSATMAGMVSRPPGAVVTPLDDGRVEVRARAKTDLLAQMHVLRYGADAEVLAPESLRLAVAEVFQRGAGLYGTPEDTVETGRSVGSTKEAP